MSKLLLEMMNRPVSEIMTKKLFTVLPTDSLKMVKEIFEKHNIHHIPVVRHLDIVGIISKTDFYKAQHDPRFENPNVAAKENQKLFENFKAEDLMTKKVVKIEPIDKIGTAVEIFLENYFHALPIVNDEGELEGIVSSYDVLKMFFHEAYPNQELNQIF
jgi:acetoin utilization protein AcuB